MSQGPVLAQVAPPEQRAGLFGLNWALFTASGFLGGVLAGYLPGVLRGALGVRDTAVAYRYTIWAGVLTLALLSLPLLRLRGSAHERALRAAGAWYRVERPGRVAALLVPVATSAAAIGFTVPFLSVFLQRTHHASTSRIGFTLGVFALIGSLGGLLGPALQRRHGPVPAVSGLLLLSGPVMLAIGYAPSLVVASLALWTRGLLANSAWPVALAHLIESVDPGQRGRVSALMNLSFELSLAAATLPAGLIMERVSYRLPYALAAGMLALGGLGYLYALRNAPRQPAAHGA